MKRESQIILSLLAILYLGSSSLEAISPQQTAVQQKMPSKIAMTKSINLMIRDVKIDRRQSDWDRRDFISFMYTPLIFTEDRKFNYSINVFLYTKKRGWTNISTGITYNHHLLSPSTWKHFKAFKVRLTQTIEHYYKANMFEKLKVTIAPWSSRDKNQPVEFQKTFSYKQIYNSNANSSRLIENH